MTYASAMTYVIGTAGHVDHGKSALVEALTGIDPDRLAEEKERAMTIDLGFAWLTLPGGASVGIVDVPGHRDFIENMLAGVGGIDLVLLVIAADEGIMPQTREHLAILDLLDVQSAVVALTKTDLIKDPEWLDLVTLEIAELLSTTALRDAPIVPVSALTGEGLDDLLSALDAALAGQPPRADRGRPRLPVDRVFSISGFGTVVTGTLSGGALRVGDEVMLAPSGRRARIRGLQSHKESIEVARPGSRVAINLSGIDRADLARGDVVTRPGLLSPTTLIDVRFRHLPGAGRPLRHNAEVKFFSGAAESIAHVRLVGDKELSPGAEGWLQLRLAEPLALDRGDRFILRTPSPPQTIGGGEVLDAHPPHRWRRFKPAVIERFETLAAGSPADLLLHALEGAPLLTLDEAARSAGLPTDEAVQAAGELAEQGALIRPTPDLLMAPGAWARLAGRITRELSDYHAAHPLRRNMPREALRSRLALDARPFQALAAYAAAEGVLVEEGAGVRLPGHAVTFTPAQQAAVDALLQAIAEAPTAPPGVKDSAAMVGADVLEVLIERGTLIQVSPDVLFDAETYDRLVAGVAATIEQEGAITVARARDLFATTRKYVLALLEHLDATGVTRRTGDERVLRDAAG